MISDNYSYFLLDMKASTTLWIEYITRIRKALYGTKAIHWKTTLFPCGYLKWERLPIRKNPSQQQWFALHTKTEPLKNSYICTVKLLEQKRDFSKKSVGIFNWPLSEMSVPTASSFFPIGVCLICASRAQRARLRVKKSYLKEKNDIGGREIKFIDEFFRLFVRDVDWL